MKVFVFCCAILACAAAVSAAKCTSEQSAKYLEYKKQFGKTNVDKNEDAKCLAWLKSVAEVKACNANPKVHDCGINYLSDFTDAERAQMFGYKNPVNSPQLLKLRAAANKPPTLAATVVLPDAVDWRVKGAVSPMKNQGGCGSCWAFSSVGVLEGQNWIKNKKMITLSEQQMVDCTPANWQCNGGWMVTAFQAVQSLGGIFKNASYPYFSGNTVMNGTCQFNAAQTTKIGAKIASIVVIPAGDQLALKTAVATVGPIAVAFDAGSIGNYKSGVFADPNCRQNVPNHAVLIVGYGTNKTTGVDYWIVKNQWGLWWGDKGYINLPRNVTAANKAQYSDCGITNWASYALLA